MSHVFVTHVRNVSDVEERRWLIAGRLAAALHPLPQTEQNGKQMKKYFRRHEALKTHLFKLIK